MNLHRISRWFVVAAVATLVAGFGLVKARAAQPDPAAGGEEVEVLTRGPVHEAFAETVTFDPEPGIVVPQAPPEAIEELPPDQKPEGDNVAWIPGYWAWDDERSDYLWVSGVWRALPPDRQWVPGYWGQSGQDFQWTSGYWAEAEASEVEYLPEPPATIEIGPNIEAPSADHAWLPGCWVWRNDRYAWRPGYWATVQPDWVWIPAHYVYSRRGYVFVDGYWDYPMARRGILFAPVYFAAGVHTRPGFFYSPVTVINPAVLDVHLFLRPQYGHYYFGDYYAANYSTAGFYSWFSFHNQRGYDPIYAHARWSHREDRDWEHHVESDFRNRRDHEDARPPRTWAAQRERAASAVRSDESSFVVTTPLEEIGKSKTIPLRFQPVAKEERKTLAERAREVRRSQAERQQREITAPTSADQPAEEFPPAGESRPARVKLPRSPIVARPAAEFGEGRAPPTTQAVPEPDPKVEPKPRRRQGKPAAPQAGPTRTDDAAQPDAAQPDAPKQRKPRREPETPQAKPPVADKPPVDAPEPKKPDRKPETPRAEPPATGDRSPPDAPKPKPPKPQPKG